MPPSRRRPAEPPRRRPVVAGQRSRRRPELGTAAEQAVEAEQQQSRRRRRPAAADAPTSGAGETRRRRRLPLRVPPVVPGVLGLVAVALAVGVGFLAWELLQLRAADAARDEALATASSHAVKILSYDASTLDEDFSSARDVITGDFGEQYAQTTEELVRPTATENDVSVIAEVAAVSVVSAEPDEVVVLAFVNQTTTSNLIQGPKIDQNRVQMTLVEVDDEWKVSAVTAL